MNGPDSEPLRSRLLEVVTALWFEVDHHDGAGASSFFTPEATLQFQDAVFRGTRQIDQVYADRSRRGPRVSRHIVTNLHIVEADDRRARATSILLLFAEDGTAPRSLTTPALVADVDDVFERHDDGWLIASRRTHHQFIAPSTTLAVPTT